MSDDSNWAAFLRAEAAYLTPPENDCLCDCDPCRCEEDFEPDFETIAEERAERRLARYEL